MRNIRQRGTAFVLALVVGLGMVMSSTPAYAHDGERLRALRCRILLHNIAEATENNYPRLAAFLQARYDELCK